MMFRSLNIRRVIKCYTYNFSTVSPSTANVKPSNDEKKSCEKSEATPVDQSKLVAAAFASLKDMSNHSNYKDSIREEISSAKNLESLLLIVEKPFLSRPNALMILSTLTNWANEGKLKLSDFELDSRFAKLCRIIGRSHGGKYDAGTGDLSVVLGVTADEQAAKLISSISLSQMTKILKSLSIKKRRSTPLLRSLAFNISNATEQLRINDASDVFYALAELNYYDEALMVKVREDFRECLAANTSSSVVCSTIRSLGLLRYRDTELLDELTEWIVKRYFSLEVKEHLPLLFTLACVNYLPGSFHQFYKILEPHINENKMVDITKLIDVVWSLVILQQYNERVINSVMDPDFISKLTTKYGSEENIDVPEKTRLLQINGAAKLLADSYKGPLLEKNSALYQVPLTRRKEKQIIVDSIKDTLSNVVGKMDEYVEADINSNMGFAIDLVCYVNKQSNLVKIDEDHAKREIKKVALMICDYHDYCRGCHNEITGSVALKHRLLSRLGYIVLPIPYSEYNYRDVLMNRVRYINEKIKTAIIDT